jgi:beta-lactam-binding protein with PASTA domain
MDKSSADTALTNAGFRVQFASDVQDDASCRNVGNIASQDPAGGGVFRLGTTVSLRVFVPPAPPRQCG